MLDIPDANAIGVADASAISESGTISRIRVGVQIAHSYIGDLRVTLESPLGRRAVLHAQLGGSTDNLVATYDSNTPGELASLIGQPMQGNWILSVVDRAAQDVGVLQNWRLELTSAAVGEAPVMAEQRAATRAYKSDRKSAPPPSSIAAAGLQ